MNVEKMAENQKPYSIPACNLALAVRGEARFQKSIIYNTKFRKGAMEALVEGTIGSPHALERKELKSLLERPPYDDRGREIVESQRSKIMELGLYEYVPLAKKMEAGYGTEERANDAAMLTEKVLKRLDAEPGSLKTYTLADGTLRIAADFKMDDLDSSQLAFLEKEFGGGMRKRHEDNSWQVKITWSNWGTGELLLEHDSGEGTGDFVLDLHGLDPMGMSRARGSISEYRKSKEMENMSVAEFMRMLVENFRAAPDSICAVRGGQGALQIRWGTVARLGDSDLEPLKRRFGDEDVQGAHIEGEGELLWMGKGIGKTFFTSRFPSLSIGRGSDGNERAVLDLFGIGEDEYREFERWANSLRHERARFARLTHD